MSPDSRRGRIASLFVRASVVRHCFVTVLLVTSLLTAIPAASAALALSPEQMVVRDLGDFDASVQFPVQVAIGGDVPSLSRVDRAMAAEGAHSTELALTALEVPTGEAQATSLFIERNWSHSYGRYELVSGAWPAAVGEVVVVNKPSRLDDVPPGSMISLFNGKEYVKIVGFASDPFAEGAPALLAAPGTWKYFSKDLRVNYPNIVAGITEYWKAPSPIPSDVVVQAWTDSNPQASSSDTSTVAVTYTTRAEILATNSDQLLTRFPLSLILPLLSLSMATALLVGMAVRRWSSRIGWTLWQVGVPAPLVAQAGRHAAILATAAGLLSGAVVGTVIAGLSRPALEVMSSQPLSPWTVPWGALGLVSMGFAVGLAVSVSSRPPKWRTPRARWLHQVGVVCAVGVAATALAGGITTVSVSVMTAAVIAAMALSAPYWLQAVTLLPSQSGALSKLPRLLIAAESKRASIALGGLILALALPMCAIAVVMSAEAAEERASVDTLPGGYVILDALDDGGIPEIVRSRFEQYTGLRDPVSVVMLLDDQRIPDFSGAIWEFRSSSAVEKWLRHSLSPDQLTVLRNGILTTTDIGKSSISLRGGNTTITLPASSLEVEREWPQHVGGVLVDGIAPKKLERAPAALIYVDVTPEQIALVKSAPSSLGFSRDYVQYPHRTDRLTFPLRYFIAVAATGFAPILIMGAWAWSQARQLRPVLASLHALGVPRRIVASIIARQAGLLICVAGIATAICVSVAAIATSLGGEDHVLVVPWQAVGIALLSGLGSIAVGTAAGMHRLVAAERLNT